jgi:hypothetical protein
MAKEESYRASRYPNKNSIRYKIGQLVDNALPRSFGLGPPLPTGLQIDWPKTIRMSIPHPVGMLSDKVDLAKARVVYAISGIRW